MDWLDLIILPVICYLWGKTHKQKGLWKQNSAAASAFGVRKMKTVSGQEEGLFCFSTTCVKLQSEKACKSDLFCL